MGPLLRLVHSLEKKRGVPFVLQMRLTRLDNAQQVYGVFDETVHGPRAFIVGDSDRVQLTAPGQLRARHIVVVAYPSETGVELRIVNLHPDKTLSVDGGTSELGGVVAHTQATVEFDGLRLEVEAHLTQSPAIERFPGVLRELAVGRQLAFHQVHSIRPVGAPVSSFGGMGGHAIPALVQSSGEGEPLIGALVLHARDGVLETQPSLDDLRLGLLIGRSRRCVLGRGFDENDGLSRVHALVMLLGSRVYAFDLASRYGLRDVSRPSRVVSAARIDHGAGCLVYGAGLLMYEPR